MAKLPLILVSPSVEKFGVEFHDLSTSLSVRYNSAVLQSGGIPVTAPTSTDRAALAEAVARTDGVLLTGGDDINPQLYENHLPKKVLATVEQTPDGGGRDLRELILIDEIFRQCKPLLAICRGHQMLNVAFGGKLVADIPQQVKRPIRHAQMDKPMELVHEVCLTPRSLLSRICDTHVMGVNSTHHQGVERPAEPFCIAAASDDGIVEAMEFKRGYAKLLPFFLSVQFHPERLVHKHARYRAIFETFVSACKT